jgi:hypothetical protein
LAAGVVTSNVFMQFSAQELQNPTQFTGSTQSPSPNWQSVGWGHAFPLPDGGMKTVTDRSSALSHAAVQALIVAKQSTSAMVGSKVASVGENVGSIVVMMLGFPVNWKTVFDTLDFLNLLFFRVFPGLRQTHLSLWEVCMLEWK